MLVMITYRATGLEAKNAISFATQTKRKVLCMSQPAILGFWSKVIARDIKSKLISKT